MYLRTNEGKDKRKKTKIRKGDFVAYDTAAKSITLFRIKKNKSADFVQTFIFTEKKYLEDDKFFFPLESSGDFFKIAQLIACCAGFDVKRAEGYPRRLIYKFIENETEKN